MERFRLAGLLLMAALTTVALAGCGGDEGAGDEPSGDEASTPGVTEAALAMAGTEVSGEHEIGCAGCIFDVPDAKG